MIFFLANVVILFLKLMQKLKSLKNCQNFPEVLLMLKTDKMPRLFNVRMDTHEGQLFRSCFHHLLPQVWTEFLQEC